MYQITRNVVLDALDEWNNNNNRDFVSSTTESMKADETEAKVVEPYFELTDETIIFRGRTLHRIKYIRKMSCANHTVQEGELGGFVEKPENIQIGSLVLDDAIVMDDAKITDKSIVQDDAIVCNNARVSDAIVKESSIVGGNATVENSSLGGETSVFQNAIVRGISTNGHIDILGEARVVTKEGRSVLCGWMNIRKDARIYTATPMSIVGSYTIGQSACISGPQDVTSFCGVGSRMDTLTVYRTKYDGVRLVTGCFEGDLTEFRKQVAKKCPDSVVCKYYEMLANAIQLRFISHETKEYKEDLLGTYGHN